MKNLILILFLACTSSLIFAQSLSNVQYTMVSKRTADWCPYCGTWGWTAMHDLETKLANKNVLLWAIHYSGGLANTTTQAIAANFGGGGQPIFYLNEDDVNMNSSNVNATVNEIVESVDLINSLPPIAQMGAQATLTNDNQISVNSELKINEDIAFGELYVGIYLIRDNFVSYQASVGAQAVHTNVLDKSLLPTTFGNLIGSAPLASGSTYFVSATLDNFIPQGTNLSDNKIAVVLWNKSGNKYLFLNATLTDVTLQSNNKDLSKNGELGCKCLSEPGNLSVKLSNHLEKETKLSLIDAQGRLVSQKFGKLTDSDFNLDTKNIMAGIYFVYIQSGNKTLTQSVFIK